MSFRRQIIDYLRIAGLLGNALLIKAGANSIGQGQAVIQFWSGGADELYPGEITAINDGPDPGNNDSLFLLAPAKGSTGGAGRGYLQLFARTALYPSSVQLGGDFAVIRGDTISLVPQSGIPATTVQVRDSLQGVDSNGNPATLRLTCPVTVSGVLQAPTVKAGALTDTAGKPLIQSGSGSIPSIAAGGGFASQYVAFPTAFGAAPRVVAIPDSGRLNAEISAVSSSGFTVGFNNWTSFATAGTFMWIATRL